VTAASFGIRHAVLLLLGGPRSLASSEAGIPARVTFAFLNQLADVNEVALVLLGALFGPWIGASLHGSAGTLVACRVPGHRPAGLERYVEDYSGRCRHSGP